MTYLILSDVHANLEALDTVLAAAGTYDHVLMLGDLVGYGANPNEVIERLRALPSVTFIRGNHDKAATRQASVEHFNHLAKFAVQWTTDQLTPENFEWLAALPVGPLAVDELIEICHGAPFDEDAYIFDDLDVRRAMAAASRPLCLFGHTHVQVGYALAGDQFTLTTIDERRPLVIPFARDTKHLVNPGSVGQPRDGDSRAGFGIVDTDRMEMSIYRTEYPIQKAQLRILEEGLPEVLAQRLALGR